MSQQIKAQKDLYNNGKCFTKGEVYDLPMYSQISTEAGLMDITVINDQGERHRIGVWWRDFKLVR